MVIKENLFQQMLTDSDTKNIHNILNKFFNDMQKVEKWLNTPNPNLGNSTPQKLMDNGRSHKVLSWIESTTEYLDKM